MRMQAVSHSAWRPPQYQPYRVLDAEQALRKCVFTESKLKMIVLMLLGPERATEAFGKGHSNIVW